MSNICPVLAEETCCLIAFLNNFSNGSNIVNDRVFAWTHPLTLILNHVGFLNNHELSLGFLLFQMLLFSYILKMLCKLNPILTYEKVTTCFTYLEWVSGWVCVCVRGGGGKSILSANGNDVPTSITIRETLSESSLNV